MPVLYICEGWDRCHIESKRCGKEPINRQCVPHTHKAGSKTDRLYCVCVLNVEYGDKVIGQKDVTCRPVRKSDLRKLAVRNL